MQRIYGLLASFTRWADRTVEAVVGSILVVTIVLNGSEIVSRSLAGHSFYWLYEVNQLLANWMYFLGIYLIYNRGQDVKVEFLYDLLPQRAQRSALALIHLLTIAVFVLLVYVGVDLLALQSSGYSMGIRIPNHFFSMPIVVGSVLMAIAVLRQVIAVWCRIDEDAEHHSGRARGW